MASSRGGSTSSSSSSLSNSSDSTAATKEKEEHTATPPNPKQTQQPQERFKSAFELDMEEMGQVGWRMYQRSMDAMITRLLKYTETRKLAYLAELNTDGSPIPKMDHLVCFVPGMLALGATCPACKKQLAAEVRALHLEVAEELMRTCYAMYEDSPTFLAPEIVQVASGVGSELHVDPASAHNILRPETVESLFYMWRITKDPKYREWGWNIFVAFHRWARVCSGGYTGLKDVRVVEGLTHGWESDPDDLTAKRKCKSEWPNFKDHMESFYLSETLKYLYLLFSEDDVLPLDSFVFNTEGHPFPRVFSEAYHVH